MLTVERDEELLVIKSERPLKVLSSAMVNPGIGYYQYFVNRTVSKDYYPEDAKREYEQFLQRYTVPLQATVAMMTAVPQRFVMREDYLDGGTSIDVFITAGLGNAVDVTQSYQYTYRPTVGTINIFVFINGDMSDEALIQAYNCIIEAKVKVLSERHILDKKSGTVATGTSTDSIALAVTKQGEYHEYGGSITRLGALIGKGVAATLHKAIDGYDAYQKGELQ
ncbi:adenosylcobinamide amidohydrolase [Metasolibacillus meyeri]|uniref:Adenosylcobinamide amidohydrolase n=1 Tax=Metasolibacillus meyeri TaxID=1071052 RepID=A0AAW9NZA5_9BACL|nr:adenosylcobinamide amidohydrolase [Metasolibacillus meyeri]MEC1180610.1 adenosylcobinamide amidohydrolase [Metasolibacillus meyeri]